MRRALLPFAALLVATLLARADWNTEKDTFGKAYSSESPADRAAAVRALKDFDHPDGMALLLECYRAEKDTDVRRALADAMNAVRAVKARDVFRTTILTHPDPDARARFCAVFADARMQDRFDMLRSLLRDEAPVVRARALRNLGPQDTALLADAAKRLADAAVEVRMAACQALAAIRSLDGCGGLVAALEMESNAEVRWGAQDALAKLSGEDFGDDVAAWKRWWDTKRLGCLPEVDQAITRGADFLKAQIKAAMDAAKGMPAMGGVWARGDEELAIYALIHAGVPREDPILKEGIEHLLTMPVNRTYTVAIAAMALADLDPRLYADRLAEFAQWLTDTQATSGMWSYGYMNGTPARTPARREKQEKTPSPGAGDTEAALPQIRIVWRNHQRPPGGDNSNTQYALLGLRATVAGGCVIPKEVWTRSRGWFQRAQCADGSWGYIGQGAQGYGSMTVGGMSSLAICLHELGEHDELQPEKIGGVKAFRAAFDWMKANWSVVENPKAGGNTFYYLYGLERAGMILGMRKFGEHDWYEEGCAQLLKLQQEDGRWQEGMAMYDTCFAILFLRRATKGYTISAPGK